MRFKINPIQKTLFIGKISVLNRRQKLSFMAEIYLKSTAFELIRRTFILHSRLNANII